MGKDKQVKKPYLAPKCEVIQMEAHNLMKISAGVGGFTPGGNLSKEHTFDFEDIPDSDEGTTFETGNSQTGKEKQP